MLFIDYLRDPLADPIEEQEIIWASSTALHSLRVIAGPSPPGENGDPVNVVVHARKKRNAPVKHSGRSATMIS